MQTLTGSASGPCTSGNTIRTAIRKSTIPPAIDNAGSEIPSEPRSGPPAKRKPASRAEAMRSSRAVDGG